jgi:Zn ribbon nucleic-acid-binding protein
MREFAGTICPACRFVRHFSHYQEDSADFALIRGG